MASVWIMEANTAELQANWPDPSRAAVVTDNVVINRLQWLTNSSLVEAKEKTARQIRHGLESKVERAMTMRQYDDCERDWDASSCAERITGT